MSPDVARQALIATHGGLSLEWCATICPISPMALYRLLCALGQHSLVTVLVKGRLPLPTYILVDAKHSHCLTDRVYVPPIASGRVLWHLGYSACKSAAAFTAAYGVFQRAALAHEPSSQGKGALTDGFDRTVGSMRTLFPKARLGGCLRHALNKLPEKLVDVSASVRRGLHSQCHALWHRCRPRNSLRVVALGQRLRHFAPRLDMTVCEAHGARMRHWFETKKAGWYAVLAAPRMPAMRTVVEQAHTAMDRTLCAMKGLHHPGGSQEALLTGLAHLYNLIPYQRRALNTGKCGVAVAGGGLPTPDWMTNLPILTSGGYRCALEPPNHSIRWNVGNSSGETEGISCLTGIRSQGKMVSRALLRSFFGQERRPLPPYAATNFHVSRAMIHSWSHVLATRTPCCSPFEPSAHI